MIQTLCCTVQRKSHKNIMKNSLHYVFLWEWCTEMSLDGHTDRDFGKTWQMHERRTEKAESSVWHGLSSKLARTRQRGRSLIHIHRGGFMKWQEKKLNTQIGLFVIQMFLRGRSNLIGWIKHEKGGAWSTGFLAKQPLTEPHCEGKTWRGDVVKFCSLCAAMLGSAKGIFFLSFFCYAETVSVVEAHSKHGPEARSAAVLSALHMDIFTRLHSLVAQAL